VGLGNIWKFPCITGVYGGGTFVLVYLLCIAAIGILIMMAEVMIGRRGQQSPIRSMAILAKHEGRPSAWQAVGWSGALGAFLREQRLRPPGGKAGHSSKPNHELPPSPIATLFGQVTQFPS
jgi:hypothetical protein